METTQTTQDLSRADFDRLEARLDALNKKIDYIVDRQRWQADLVDEFGPIAREAMKVGADRLHQIDQDGYFAFGREALRVVERIVTSYSEDDVRLLGDHIVGIMDTVKNITQPAILAVANEATDVLYNADDVAPMGVMGMVKASQDDEVQKGMAIMFEVLRQIGRTVSDVAEGGQPRERARISGKRAAPGRGSPSNGSPSNGSSTDGRRGRPNGTSAKEATPRQATPSPTNGTGANGAGANGGGQEGWQLTDDGHLADPAEWSKAFAIAMAGTQGVLPASMRTLRLDPRSWPAADVRHLAQPGGLGSGG